MKGNVAGDGTDPEDLNKGRAQGCQDGDPVIRAGISVENNLLLHRTTPDELCCLPHFGTPTPQFCQSATIV